MVSYVAHFLIARWFCCSLAKGARQPEGGDCKAARMGNGTADRGALILVVDDDTVETTAAVQALNASGYQTLARPDGLTGLIAVEEVHPALVVLDWGLPFLTGDTFLFALRTGLAMPPPVIAVLDASDDPAPPRASGARATLARPLDLAALVAAVHTILGGAAAA